jgi:hypothetical protein
MAIALLIEEMSEKNTTVICYVCSVNKAILCSGNNDIDLSAKKFLTVLADKLKEV